MYIDVCMLGGGSRTGGSISANETCLCGLLSGQAGLAGKVELCGFDSAAVVGHLQWLLAVEVLHHANPCKQPGPSPASAGAHVAWGELQDSIKVEIVVHTCLCDSCAYMFGGGGDCCSKVSGGQHQPYASFGLCARGQAGLAGMVWSCGFDGAAVVAVPQLHGG